jgi:hypothetical protein
MGQLPTMMRLDPGWSRSNHLFKTRWLSSSDDRDKNFSGTLGEPELR